MCSTWAFATWWILPSACTAKLFDGWFTTSSVRVRPIDFTVPVMTLPLRR